MGLPPTSGQAPLTVNLNASGSTDSDGVIVAYGWASSDGQSRLGVSTSFTFPVPGTYEIGLSVVDDEGAADFTSRSITVTEPINPCSIQPQIGLNALIVGSLSGSDCNIASYFGDLFRIAIPTNGTLTVAMESATIDVRVGITTSDLSTILAEDDDSGDPSTAQASAKLSVGNYLVVATSFDTGETGSYVLTTEFVPEPSAVAMELSVMLTLSWFARRERSAKWRQS